MANRIVGMATKPDKGKRGTGEQILVVRCRNDRDFEQILSIINDGAQAYTGIIPADCWTDPYMSEKALAHEINEGVVFWGFEQASTLVGVMGIQEVQDVTLIRHAYVFITALVEIGWIEENSPVFSEHAGPSTSFRIPTPSVESRML
jgi:hypothetical protein